MRGTVKTAETKTSAKGRTYYNFTLEGSDVRYSAFDSINQGDEIEFEEVIKDGFHNAKNIKKLNESKATKAGLEPQSGEVNHIYVGQKTKEEVLAFIAIEAIKLANGNKDDFENAFGWMKAAVFGKEGN